MAVKPIDFSAVQNEDAVGVLHAGNALRHDQLCGSGNFLCKSCPNLRIGGRIHGAGGIVQNQNLWLFQKCAGNAQALFLAAGNIAAALLNPGMVPVGEALDKFIRAGLTTGLGAFVLGGVFLAPAKVLQNRTGEQDVFLQHHGHLIAQGLRIIGAHIFSADADAAAVHIV